MSHQHPLINPMVLGNNYGVVPMMPNYSGVGVGVAGSSKPSPLVEPPPLLTIKYSAEKVYSINEQQDLTKQFSRMQLVDMENSPSARLVNNNLFSSSSVQQPTTAIHASTMFNLGMMNPINPYTTPSQQVSEQPPPIEKPPQYLFDKSHFNPSGTTLSKTSSGAYSSIFVNTALGGSNNKGTIYKWDVKIKSIKSWLAVGVAQTQIGDGYKFSFSPYDEHGAYLLSANGYVWNRQIEGTNKYEHVANSSFVSGDILSLELNCGKKELTFYRNSGKLASVSNINLPVYPSFMMHGLESVEFMGLKEFQSTIQEQQVEFSYLNYHMIVEGKKLTKKTKDSYHTIFLKNLMGDSNNFGLYKWKIKILATNSWLGLGVVSKEIANGRFHHLSPYENHGGYIYSMNGYGWSAFYEGANKYTNCGSTCSSGDIITLELNCASKELTLTRDGKNLITFKQVYLPVYPFIMMHGTESVELIEFYQEASYSNPDAFKFDGILDFKHNHENIENVGCKLSKLTETGYSNIFVNRELGSDQIIKRYKVKINNLASWVGIGVIKKENASTCQTSSPYDNNGAYFISANGYVWDSNQKDPKYKAVEAAKFIRGDTIILELNCVTKELNFYKNNITNKIATIERVLLPVYPYLMLYGKEELEFFDYLDNVVSDSSSLANKKPSFKYLPLCISVTNDNTLTKTTTNSYSTVFVNTPLGKLHQESTFKWQVKIISLSWIGLGVMRREVADKSSLTFSPYDDHGCYFLSANGYVWNRQLADPYYLNVEGATFQKGDVLVFILDCKQQSLTISRNNSTLTRIDNIRLPVYPSFLLHGMESLEFSWIK